eukprot:2911894-Prymnesium_polylepis.2
MYAGIDILRHVAHDEANPEVDVHAVHMDVALYPLDLEEGKRRDDDFGLTENVDLRDVDRCRRARRHLGAVHLQQHAAVHLR